jgi:Ca-activated chloride channel homolog
VLRRVVLLGDGVPNDAAPITNLAQQFAGRGVEITALGYGLDYDEVLLASLAEQTHGQFRFVEQPEAVAGLFRDEVLHIQRTVAQDLQLALGLGPKVRLIEVVGHPVQVDGRGRRVVALGSISEGQGHELLVRLAVGPHSDGATVELLDLELGFSDLLTGTGARFERTFLSATASSDSQAIAAALDLDIARAGARARTNAATLEVLALARTGQLAQAKSLLAESVKWAKREAEALSDVELETSAKQLAALAPELEALARPQANSAGQGGPQAFPAQPSAAGSRAVKAAHSAAYNDLH